MSVMEVVRIACHKGKGDEFQERLRVGLRVQVEDPNCLEVYFQRCLERPDEFLLNLSWTSVAAHEAWRATPERDRWRSHISDLLEGQTQMLGHYELVSHIDKKDDD